MAFNQCLSKGAHGLCKFIFSKCTNEISPAWAFIHFSIYNSHKRLAFSKKSIESDLIKKFGFNLKQFYFACLKMIRRFSVNVSNACK